MTPSYTNGSQSTTVPVKDGLYFLFTGWGGLMVYLKNYYHNRLRFEKEILIFFELLTVFFTILYFA